MPEPPEPSCGSRAPKGGIGKAGRRAKGGGRKTSELPGLPGRKMRKSLLILNAMMWFPLESFVPETSLCSLGGADEKGPAIVPRQPPTSFGEGVTGGAVMGNRALLDRSLGIEAIG